MAAQQVPRQKPIPQRTCTGCGEVKPKNQMIRVVRAPDGTISLDATGKKSGRGAYLCPSPACLRKARKTRRLERNLNCPIPDEIYEALEREMQENA